MNRNAVILILSCMIFLLSASCGSKEVKRVSEDSKTAIEAFSVIEEIRDSYVKNDLALIEKNVTKDGFKAISSVLKSFDSVELTFNPVWVEIEGDHVNVNISWKGKWQKAGKITEERGMAVFVLKGRPLKVDNILRTNPFKYPE